MVDSLRSQQEVDYLLWRVQLRATHVLENRPDARVDLLATDALTLVHIIKEQRKQRE